MTARLLVVAMLIATGPAAYGRTLCEHHGAPVQPGSPDMRAGADGIEHDRHADAGRHSDAGQHSDTPCSCGGTCQLCPDSHPHRSDSPPNPGASVPIAATSRPDDDTARGKCCDCDLPFATGPPAPNRP